MASVEAGRRPALHSGASNSHLGTDDSLITPDHIHKTAWQKLLAKATNRILNYSSLGHPAAISEAMRKREREKSVSQISGTGLTLNGKDLRTTQPEDPLDARATKDLGLNPFIDGSLHAISIALELDMPKEYLLDRLSFLRWVIYAPYTMQSKMEFSLNIAQEYEGEGQYFMEALRTDSRLSSEHLVKSSHAHHDDRESRPHQRNKRRFDTDGDPKIKSPARRANNNPKNRGNGNARTASRVSPGPKAPFVRQTTLCKGCSDPGFICKGVGICSFTHTCSKCQKNHALNWCDA
jgi:hypothetical protein